MNYGLFDKGLKEYFLDLEYLAKKWAESIDESRLSVNIDSEYLANALASLGQGSYARINYFDERNVQKNQNGLVIGFNSGKSLNDNSPILFVDFSYHRDTEVNKSDIHKINIYKIVGYLEFQK